MRELKKWRLVKCFKSEDETVFCLDGYVEYGRIITSPIKSIDFTKMIAVTEKENYILKNASQN